MGVLHLYFGAEARVYLTLSELVTLDPVYYLFVFETRAIGNTVAIVLEPADTNERAEEFAIDVDTVFEDMPVGQYTYKVYEQSDADNTDPAQAGALLERGIMQLNKETPFAFVQHASTTTFIQPVD